MGNAVVGPAEEDKGAPITITMDTMSDEGSDHGVREITITYSAVEDGESDLPEFLFFDQNTRTFSV